MATTEISNKIKLFYIYYGMQIKIKASVCGRYRNIYVYPCYELSHSETIGSLLALMRLY